MKIGTRTRYGLRTMIEIARGQHSKGVFQKDIAIAQSLSNKYLDHIIHALKTSGLITNVKGKKSGYLLARSPELITVYDIHKAFEPEICLVECLSANYHCERDKHCEAQGFWLGLNSVIARYLRSVTLADFINGDKRFHPSQKEPENMQLTDPFTNSGS